MSRRRYRYDPDLKAVVEIGADWVDPTAAGPLCRSEEEVYGKLGRATDGTDISTKRRHRQYCKDNNVTVSEDFKGVWAKAEEHRAKVSVGDFDHERRRDTIARAAYQLEKKGRR
jgi:hypothetical protein